MATIVDQVNQLLEARISSLDSGEEVTLQLAVGVSPKTFGVYARDWWNRRSLREHNPPKLRVGFEANPLGYLIRLRLVGRAPSQIASAPEEQAIRDHFASQQPAPLPIATPDISVRPAPGETPTAAALHDVLGDESALLELWAEFCVSHSLPLDSVLAACGGSVPSFVPTSQQGFALITAARSRK